MTAGLPCVGETCGRAIVGVPNIFVYIPKASAADLESAIVEYEAARSTLDFKGTPTTPEGREARDAMATRMATAEATRNQIVLNVIDGAKVYQGGGSERHELTLVARVEDAANASLDRMFPEFRDADDNRWSTVINRAKNGDEHALSALDWNDTPLMIMISTGALIASAFFFM